MKTLVVFFATTGIALYAGIHNGFDAAIVAWIATPVMMYAGFYLTKRY